MNLEVMLLLVYYYFVYIIYKFENYETSSLFKAISTAMENIRDDIGISVMSVCTPLVTKGIFAIFVTLLGIFAIFVTLLQV